MLKKKLAICIPTYERSKIIEEFLGQCMEYYSEYDADVYIYDSSVDNLTQEIVFTWQERVNNLYYVRLPENIHANMKVFKIFQQFRFKYNYDYIWMCGDSQRYTKEAMDIIIPYLMMDYDIITVDGNDKENLGVKSYDDYNEYCRENAWHLTLFGGAILNVNTMLQGVDWNFYEETYSTEELINFSHVSFYFHRIVELKNFKAIHIGFKEVLLRYSELKKVPGWYEKTFFIMCCAWVETVNHFPACYKDKKETLIKHGRYTILNTLYFLKFRNEHIFNIKVFNKYRRVWNQVCDVSIIKLWLIAIISPKVAGKLKIFIEYKSDLKSGRNLRKFCHSFNKIFIYGAGKKAIKYGNYLMRKKIVYQGFCVTQKQGNKEKLLLHPVYQLDEIEKSLRDSGIIVALNPYYAEQVLPLLKEKGFEKNVFWDNKFKAGVFE